MPPEPTMLDVPVRGGSMRVARWDGEPVLAIHGLTASWVSFLPVVRNLPDGIGLVAPDLRGRGGSAGLPGPWGFRTHAEDCAALLDHLGLRNVVVAGESMGAYVGVVLAAMRPDLVSALVLVDGGLPLPVPEGVDPEALLGAVVGPAVARLDMTFPSIEAYFDFWRAHPALADDWNDDLEAYFRYDLSGDAPELRSKVSPEAIRADGADALTNPALVEESLRALACPVTLLRAPRNLLNEPQPMLPDELVARWQAEVPQMEAELVEDVNHYTLAFGGRGASIVANRISEAVSAASRA